MTVNEILDYARDLAHVTSAQFSNTKLIVWLNIVYQNLVNKITDNVAENYFINSQEIDAVTTGDGGYTYDTSMNKLKVVKIKQDSTTTEYTVSSEIDFSKQSYDITWFMLNQPISNPVHQIIGTKLYIAPQFKTGNTGGAGNKQIKLEFEDSPAALVVGGAENTIVIPADQHETLALGIVPKIDAANGKKNEESFDLVRYNNRVDEMLAALAGRDDSAMYIRTPDTSNLE